VAVPGLRPAQTSAAEPDARAGAAPPAKLLAILSRQEELREAQATPRAAKGNNARTARLCYG